MKLTPFGCLVLLLTVSPVTRAQSSGDAQAKALQEQLVRETAARKAESDKIIAADIAKNPNGANALAAKKVAEDAKTLELAKQTVEEKAKSDAEVAAKASADQQETERKDAEVRWAAGTKERERAAAAEKAAVKKWRSSGKSGPSVLMGKRSNGAFTVMVNGKISEFPTEAEAKAFADKVRSETETTLSY